MQGDGAAQDPGVTLNSPVWLSAGLRKELERFPSCVKISLDLQTPNHEENQAGPDGNRAAGSV